METITCGVTLTLIDDIGNYLSCSHEFVLNVVISNDKNDKISIDLFIWYYNLVSAS